MATVVSVLDVVEKDISAARGQWSAALRGTELAMGDGLRTGVRGEARLELVPEGLLHVQPATTIRFQSTAPGEDPSGDFNVEAGEVEVEAAFERAMQAATEQGALAWALRAARQYAQYQRASGGEGSARVRLGQIREQYAVGSADRELIEVDELLGRTPRGGPRHGTEGSTHRRR